MKALVFLLALLCGNAFAVDPPVRIFHIFTLAAKSKMANMVPPLTPTQFINGQMQDLNSAFYNSGMNTRAETAGYNDQGICCGANAGDTAYLETNQQTGQGALRWAAYNPAVHKAREAANADIVMVIDDDTADPDPAAGFSENAPCGYPGRSPHRGIVGMNLQWRNYGTYQHEVGHAMCAQHDNVTGTARGFYWVEGTSPTDCKIQGTIMAVPAPVTATVTTWTSVEPALIIPVGTGVSALQALWRMTNGCKSLTGYSCEAISCNSTGALTATCQHYRYTPPNQTQTLIGSYATAVTNTFTCPQSKWRRIVRFSNPNFYAYANPPYGIPAPGGIPFNNPGGIVPGSPTENNAAAIDAESPNVRTWRNAKVYRALVQAGF
jgi:hypothetical protein